MTLPDRFWSKVDASGDCWQWTAAIGARGYGAYGHQIDGRWVSVLAHREAWQILVGPIPDGLTIDHLCRNRACVNPDHLEPVSRGENVTRSHATITGKNVRKTHCKRGHPFTPDNIYVPPKRPDRRYCRACSRLRTHRRYNEGQNSGGAPSQKSTAVTPI